MSNAERPPSSEGAPAWQSRTTAAEGSLTSAGSGPRAISEGEEGPKSTLLAPGAIVADKYLIEGFLGEGGLGVVVSATHLHLDQKVAIKYLRGGAPRDRALTDRFLREARLAAQINSEHVARVFDVATLADGTPYMVMEYLDGADLRALLTEKGPLPLETAVDYVLQACEALAEAHVQGIVHRDLKPENLFLARRSGGKDTLKILDFGISKLSDRYTSSSRVNVVTQAGDLVGTPLYMSPEQLEAHPHVDGRTDVWAIGVVLYELLTGAMPFPGESLPALCTAVLTKTPIPATSLRPELPKELDLVVLRCLAKARDDRYQNVAELAEELRPFASSSARAHVRHIVQVTRDAGDTVRPPRWETTEAGSLSLVPVSEAPLVPRTRRSFGTVALLAGGAVAVAVLTHWLGRASTAPPVSAVAASAVAATVAAPDSVQVIPPPKPVPIAASAEEPRPPAPLREAASAVPPGSPPAPRPAKVPPSRRAPASADTSGVIDPFQ